MPDTVSAPRIAYNALRHVTEANRKLDEDSYLTSAEIKELQTSLFMATELLALIAEPDLSGTPLAPAVSVPLCGTANATGTDEP